MIDLRSKLQMPLVTYILISSSALLPVSCRLKPIDDIGSAGGASRVSSVSMPIPAKLKPYLGDGKIDAWSLSIVAGTCSSGAPVPVSHKEKFGLFSNSDVLISEKITANCAYTFVLSLGKASADKTKLEKVYLTNDLDGKRTEITAEQNKGGKVPVAVMLYFTADGTSALGTTSGTSIDSAPPTNNTPSPDSTLNNNTLNQPAPQPTADATCYKGDPVICKIEFLIAEKTNAYRKQSGLRDLEYDAKIAFISRDWSQKQASSGSIGHSGFPNARISVYRQEFGSAPFLTAENVAYNYCNVGNEDAAASAFIDQWWNSAGHRRNMLGGHNAIGVGVYRDSRGRCYGTQIFR
jgi:uncharacterized protein YkwD